MITTTFLTNLALGFVLAAEFGQTSIEIFRRGIHHGPRQAILVAAGGTFADFIYLNMAIAGILFFLNRPEILKFLWILGGVAMTYVAINGIRAAQTDKSITKEGTNTPPFITGFLLNFIHPINLVYWVTMLGPILVKNIQETSFLTAYLNGMGIPLGVFSWWLMLSTFTSGARQWITSKIMRCVSIGSSSLLLGFAVWFFYNAFLG